MDTAVISPLRIALLVAGVVFLVCMAAWEALRARRAQRTALAAAEEALQASAAAAAREPDRPLPSPPAPRPERSAAPAPGPPVMPAAAAAAPQPVPVSVLVTAPPAPVGPPAGGPASEPPEGTPPDTLPGGLPALEAGPPPDVQWPPDASRVIVAVRLVAMPPERFPGNVLRQALQAEGFVLGKYDIFHKADENGKAYLSAANLNQPGSFDAASMDGQRFAGLSLFTVLPGPKPPFDAFDDLLTSARGLNDRLNGALQDERGLPLTPLRVAALRRALKAELPA